MGEGLPDDADGLESFDVGLLEGAPFFGELGGEDDLAGGEAVADGVVGRSAAGAVGASAFVVEKG